MSQISDIGRHVIVSQESVNEDADALLLSNMNVVNAMFDEHLSAEEISDTALKSYYVDFYTSQMATGGFEQFILQRDAVGPDAAEVLDTYSYYAGVIDGSWSMGAAAGLAKGVVGTILILASNKIAHLLGEDGIYRGSSR